LKKILIIQTAFTGDVVLATSVAENLHRKFPLAEIDFLLRKGNEGLFNKHPYLHEIIVWDKQNRKFANLFSIRKKIKNSKYDLIVNLHRFGSSGFITAFSGAKETVGFSKNPFSLFFSRRIKHVIGKENNSKHEIDRNLLLIKDIGDNMRTMPRLYPTKDDFEKADKIPAQSYICIAPASVWFTKQFPKEKWIEFIQNVNSSLKICFIGSYKDKILCEEIMIESGKQNCINFAGEFSLLETAALMKNAKMNFVNDSGPMHIASAMNAAVTAIYCSTVPAFGFGPLSLNSHVIETDKQMDCRPCGLHGYNRCPENHFECAYSIDTNKLVETINY